MRILSQGKLSNGKLYDFAYDQITLGFDYENYTVHVYTKGMDLNGEGVVIAEYEDWAQLAEAMKHVFDSVEQHEEICLLPSVIPDEDEYMKEHGFEPIPF